MSLQKDNVFDHIAVDRIAAGGTRVSWRFNEFFQGRRPFTIQLQRGESGIPEADDWTTAANGTDVGSLVDPVGKDLDPVPRAHYRVRLVDADNVVSISKPVPCEGNLNRRDWLRARALIRREVMLGRTDEGTAGWIYRQIRLKTRSADPLQVDPLLDTVINTLGSNLGTDHAGGYFAASPMQMLTLQMGPRNNKIDPDRGQVNDLVKMVKAVAYPQLSQGDVWVAAHNDERYAIGQVTVVERLREVPVMVQVELTKIQISDPIYRLSLPSPPPLTTLNRAEL